MSLLWAVCQLIVVSFCLTLRNSLTKHTCIIPAYENKNPHQKGGEIINLPLYLAGKTIDLL